MRRLAMAAMLGAMLALPAAAMAHPSENRNENGFGGGPHCHFILDTGTNTFPSHTAHASQIAHKPNGTVFGVATCP